MKHAIGCLLLLAAAAVPAAERPRDYAYGARLEADGREALYEVVLPAAAYRGVAFADLRDVRVFNGGDEVVPHAWRARRLQSMESEAQATLTLFPLRAEAGARLDGLSIRVHRGPGGAVTVDVTGGAADGAAALQRTVGYLVDLTTFERDLRALELDWRPVAAGFAGRLRIDGSDDLGAWRQLVVAPLVDLELAGQRLQQKRVDLPPQKVKYLRLSWAPQGDGTPLPELTGARAELVSRSVAAQREWALVESTKAEKPGEYAFDSRGHFPVDRVRVRLPEANTVAQVELLVRDTADKPWRRVANGVVYRLRKGDGEIVSPDLVTGPASERYWLLRVDQRGGGLGSGTPQLEVGWVPHQLVFVARGPAPFQLAYGKRDAKAAAYAIETLVPGAREDAGTTIRAAKAVEAQTINVQGAKALAATELGGEGRRIQTIDWKRWTLWGALILGVVVLGVMAWRLARQLDKPAAAPSKDAPSERDGSG